MAGRRDINMDEFWASLPPKIKASLWYEGRRLVLSSEEFPLTHAHPGRLSSMKTSPKFYLFNDAFVIVQGNGVVEYPLAITWVEHIIPMDGLLHSIQNMSTFRLIFPEGSVEVLCKELSHKSKWLGALTDTIGMAFNLPQFVSGRGDLNLDTKLELLRQRDNVEYRYRSHSDFKDGLYRGQWKNALPHGSGEFTQESTGRLYKGGFRDGNFHGDGEMHWFSDKDIRKKFIGEFRNGKMNGHGEMKYSNGDVYSGHWSHDLRAGFGRLEESSRKGSCYIGAWANNKKNGYGIYEDKMRLERYLGMWVDDMKCGPGMLVSSSGTYCEGTFANGGIAVGQDGFVIDPSGRSFVGKLGPDLKLCGKGRLSLTNGTQIEGSFGGSWHRKIEIFKATLEDGDRQKEDTDSARVAIAALQIAKLDERIGNCTVLASHKWQSIFAECEAALGFSGDAAKDVFSAWSRLASNSFNRKNNSERSQQPSPVHRHHQQMKRSNSLTGLCGRTVKIPVQLIPLERARAMTSASSVDEMKLRHRSALITSSSQALLDGGAQVAEERMEISRPLNIDESNMCCSYPSGLSYRMSMSPYAPRADSSEGSPSSIVDIKEERSCSEASNRRTEAKSDLEETVSGSFDMKETIKAYVDNAFNTPRHPLGVLMNRLETVFKESYGGMGANKYLLPHAIAEVHSIIQRMHSIVRILFPYMSGGDESISSLGLTRREGFSDSDDYISIESGYELLHSLIFVRLFPTLVTLYVLHHEESDHCYQRGVDFLREMDEERLVHFIKFPRHVCTKLAGKEAVGDIVKVIDQASNTLRMINSLFTPGEFLEHFKTAFTYLSSVEQLSGDFLLPAIVFILVKANVPHLGAYLHFLMDFAHTKAEDEYTLVTFEAAYNFIKSNAPGSS